MKRFIAYGLVVAVLGLLLLVIGCASYYKVTDPGSGKIYYTQEVETIKGGAVKLMDAGTGSQITLQNSEVKEISSDEYKKGLSAPASKPAPAPAPAPVAAPSSAPSGT